MRPKRGAAQREVAQAIQSAAFHNQPTSSARACITKPEAVMAMQPCAVTRAYCALVGWLILADARLINPLGPTD